jgi:hypothetical protein
MSSYIESKPPIETEIVTAGAITTIFNRWSLKSNLSITSPASTSTDIVRITKTVIDSTDANAVSIIEYRTDATWANRATATYRRITRGN